jgi:hypothetical protein
LYDRIRHLSSLGDLQMNPTNQSSWPSTYEDYMSKQPNPTEFWVEAYLISLSGGNNAYAKNMADSAVRDLAQHTGLVYSQNGGGNIPYQPRDEVAGCLRGAIPAMELLNNSMTDAYIAKYIPGLPDLIRRSKKALGDC